MYIKYNLYIKFFIAFYKVNKIIPFRGKYHSILVCLYYIYFYTLFRALYFSSIVLLYINILKLLINLNAIAVLFYSFSKNKKK